MLTLLHHWPEAVHEHLDTLSATVTTHLTPSQFAQHRQLLTTTPNHAPFAPEKDTRPKPTYGFLDPGPAPTASTVWANNVPGSPDFHSLHHKPHGPPHKRGHRHTLPFTLSFLKTAILWRSFTDLPIVQVLQSNPKRVHNVCRRSRASSHVSKVGRATSWATVGRCLLSELVVPAAALGM